MYCAFDLETETYYSYRRKSNPFDPRNKVVASGTKVQNERITLAYDTHGIETLKHVSGSGLLPDVTILVGFNIKFDLLYLWNQEEVQEFFKRGGNIWDCQLAEFMLNAQETEYPSLDDTAVKYGGTLKDERIKMLWDAGVQTSDIDKDMLCEYLRNDVQNTEIVYLGQLKRLADMGTDGTKFKKLIEMQMDGLLATTEMEYNGMYVDQLELEDKKKKLEEAISAVDYRLDQEIRALVPEKVFEHVNLNSNKHLAAILYGGSIGIKESVPIMEQGAAVTYKTGVRAGQQKTRFEMVQYSLPTLCNPVKVTPKNEPCVDFETLSLIAKHPNTDAGKVATLLCERRGLVKNLTTYFKAVGKLVQPDGLLHGSLNHCSVITGRLSSTAPNLQNMPKEDTDDPYSIKTVFTSRYGDDGAIINIDWKSLEFMVAEILCGDEQMTSDILNARDIHRTTAATVFNIDAKDVTAKQRGMAKAASFALLYGATENGSIGKTFHGDKTKAKLFIDTFYNRYPKLKHWHDRQLDLVKQKLKSTGVLYKGYYIKKSIVPNITGRLLAYEEATGYQDLPLPMPKLFSTIVKNYPVQSLGADIVLGMLGILWRKLSQHREKCLLINTVHDSIVIDCRKKYLQKIAKGTKLVLESSPKIFKEVFGIEFRIPLAVELSVGKSWGSTEYLGG